MNRLGTESLKHTKIVALTDQCTFGFVFFVGFVDTNKNIEYRQPLTKLLERNSETRE